MEGSEYLLTCAEIGVALAGFAALVVAIRQRGAEALSPQVRELVASLIERGLVATFLSLLPLLIAGLGASPGILWFSSSGLFVAYGLSMAWRSNPRRASNQASELVSARAYYPLYFAGWAVLSLQVVHMFGLGIQQNVWWYLVAVTWLLSSASYLFFFIVRGWVRAS